MTSPAARLGTEPFDSGPRPVMPMWASAATGLVALIWVACIGYGILKGSWLYLGPAFSIPVLYGLTRLVARWLASNDNDVSVIALVNGAWSVKVLGTFASYLIDKKFYGTSDAISYDQWGRYISAHYRHFQFGVTVAGGAVSGTKFMNLLTGVIYTFTPASLISGDVWYSWLGFIGLLAFWRAFKLAMPKADHRRYAMYVLLLPSLVYWPSSVGKEAWMIMGLGFASYGAAALVSRRPVAAAVALAAGLSAIIACRPHLAFCVFVGLVLAIILRRNRSGSPFGTWVAVGMLLLLGLVIVKENKRFFGVDSISPTSVSAQLTNAQGRTSGGGSQFQSVQGTSIANFPLAFVTVMFRPFPGEVGSATGVLTSLESLVLMGVTVSSRKSLRRVFTSFREDPYIAYCVGYILVFVIAFSSFSNFGILARERTQVLPVYLALLTLVPRSEKKKQPKRPIDEGFRPRHS